ncbi:Reticulon-domain-containing protein [Sporodiniella umbellata]|nr:Reticulon-domain-containing protein [Sporodiniella umbellata]
METYNRPLTPPDHELKNKVVDIDGLQKKQESSLPVGGSDAFGSEVPAGYRVGTAFPFEKPAAERPGVVSEKKEERSKGETRWREEGEFGSQRNETTQRIEREVLEILKWKRPMRSGCMLVMIVGGILLTRSYSLLQLGAMGLSVAIAINLVYVHFMLQGQRVISQERAAHPYQDVINNNQRSINRDSVRYYTNVFIDLSETAIRALTRIVFIDNTKTSLKWLAISFLVWKISAHLSVTTLVLLLTLSAFTFPRLYISNKDIVDAHLQRGQHYIQTSLTKAQEVAKDSIQDTYTKARAMAAQAGTTGTDAKNVMKNASIVEKQD